VAPLLTAATAAAAAVSSSVWATWGILLAAAAGGLAAEAHTRWGAALSAPLVSMFLTLAACNVGLLPAASPAYGLVHTVLVPLAVPLLLFSADLRRVAAATGQLLPAFLLGTVATVVGTVVAWATVPLPGTGGGAAAAAAAAATAGGGAAAAADAWKIAAALTARHIGGAVNFVAVCDATGATGSAVAAALAADNLVVAAFFLCLFALSRGHAPRAAAAAAAPAAPPPPPAAVPAADTRPADDAPGATAAARSAAVVALAGEETAAAFVALDARRMAAALALSAAFCVAARAILAAGLLPPALGLVPTVSLLVVGAATAAPRALAPHRATGGVLGAALMQVFFAATGATGRVAAVVSTAPAWAAFSAVQLAVHLALMLGVGGRLGGLGRAELLLASNANVGGPTTAAGMAGSRGWTPLVVPCMLVGVLGYATGTFWALAVGHWLLRGGVVPPAAVLWAR